LLQGGTKGGNAGSGGAGGNAPSARGSSGSGFTTATTSRGITIGANTPAPGPNSVHQQSASTNHNNQEANTDEQLTILGCIDLSGQYMKGARERLRIEGEVSPDLRREAKAQVAFVLLHAQELMDELG
jgi:hypothetical protein